MSTRTLPDGRVAVLVPADDAGEFYWRVTDDPAEHWVAGGAITRRQFDALLIARDYYAAGGGLIPNRRPSGGGHDEGDQATARRRYRELEGVAPVACRSAVRTACMGEWPVCPGMPAVLRDGLEAIADELRIVA